MASDVGRVEYTYKTNLIDGVPFPPFISQQRMNELRDFKLRSDDLFVVTYPKSGTTWLQQIVKLIRNGGKEDERRCNEVVLWLESRGGHMDDPDYDKNADEMPSPRSFSGHTPYHMMPGGAPHTSPSKYVYVARNPKDVAVSFYYHARSFKAFEYSGPWEHFFRLFMDGRVDSGLWFDHVLEWWKHKDEPNVLFLKFEDMKNDLCGAVKQIVDFMECDFGPDAISSIAALSTFQSMKANNATNFSWVPDHVRSSSVAQHLRKGIVGDWRSHFTVEQNKEFDAVYARRMKGTGLEFDFGGY